MSFIISIMAVSTAFVIAFIVAGIVTHSKPEVIRKRVSVLLIRYWIIALFITVVILYFVNR